MRIELHHVNLCSRDVPAMDEFYRAVLDLRPEPSLGEARVTEEGYAGKVAFLSDGDVQVHLAERDLGVGFRTGQAVNPLDRGHLAFRRHRGGEEALGGEGHPLLVAACNHRRPCSQSRAFPAHIV
jgi:catechol 2,3-dioxygenase-like lactoylglutathione lyase family enzyme